MQRPVPMCVPRPDAGPEVRLRDVIAFSCRVAMQKRALPADAQDIAQDVAVRYWLALPTMYSDNWRSWVYTATRHRMAEDMRRKKWRCERRNISIELCREDEGSQGVQVAVRDTAPDPADLVEVRLLLEEALGEMNRLTDVYRRMLVYAAHERTMPEMAAAEGIPRGTVTSRLSHARLRMRERCPDRLAV